MSIFCLLLHYLFSTHPRTGKCWQILDFKTHASFETVNLNVILVRILEQQHTSKRFHGINQNINIVKEKHFFVRSPVSPVGLQRGQSPAGCCSSCYQRHVTSPCSRNPSSLSALHMSADLVRIWNHVDMSNKVVRLPKRLPLGCMSPWPICLGSHKAVFECSWFKSSETDTPSFTEKKSWQCQQQSFLELSRFIDQISITICAKPLLQVMFTYLKTKKTLRKPGNLRVLRNCVCLVTWASAACIVYREGHMQTGNNDVVRPDTHRPILLIHETTCPVAQGHTVFGFFTCNRRDKW